MEAVMKTFALVLIGSLTLVLSACCSTCSCGSGCGTGSSEIKKSCCGSCGGGEAKEACCGKCSAEVQKVKDSRETYGGYPKNRVSR